MTDFPPVAIVILNWNGLGDTIECVESCRRLAYPEARILIVDNGSADGSEAALRERFPAVEVMQTGENLGFAGGNNAGIGRALAAGAEYVWLLNNDTTVDPAALGELIAAAAADPSIGIAGSKIYYHGDPATLWFAGGWINPVTGSTGHYGQYEEDEGQFDTVREVGYIAGCSLLISRRAIETCGLMDERFFLLYEEADWNERVRKAGYRIVFVPASKVWHKVSRSIGEYSPTYAYYSARNALLFASKHHPLCLPTVFLQRIRELLRHARHGRSSHAAGMMEGVLDFCRRRFGAMQTGGGRP